MQNLQRVAALVLLLTMGLSGCIAPIVDTREGTTSEMASDTASDVDMNSDMMGQTIASGLNLPQGVLVDGEGAVWVIDSGVGGEEEVLFFTPGSEEATPSPFGNSARVVKITPDGEQMDIAMLPSVAAGRDIIGGGRLALIEDKLYATVGQWLAANGPDRPPLMGSVVEIIPGDGAMGEVVENANLWATEKSINPDGFVVDSHPYGLTVGPNGKLWVVDSGANDLLLVDPATGETEVVVVFDGQPRPFPNGNRGGAMETDPVPTAVAFDSDGNAYVALLPGFPFAPGSAKIVKIDAAGEITDYATGLTMVTDLQAAPDGTFYAIQHAIFGERGPTPNSGAILHIQEGGVSEAIVEGLSLPTAIAFNEAGDAYVTINGNGPPGLGEVVLFSGLAGGE